MKLIATIVLILIFFRLIASLSVRFLTNRARKSGLFGNQQTHQNTTTPQKNKKKVIRKDAGDYVDFEEIEKP